VQRRELLLTGLAALAGTQMAVPARAADTTTPPAAPPPAGPVRTYALSLVGKPNLPPDFPHFPYANPDAPRGGEVVLAEVGSFDSFNPFIVRGTAPGGLADLWDTLLRTSADEPDTSYCHLAETVEIGADHSYVAFELREQARFNDGLPVTADDVVWTFDALRKGGRPFYRQYYTAVDRAVAESPRRVVFHLKARDNRELPKILGDLTVLSKKFFEGRDFTAPLTEPPLGSGPYAIGHFEFGRTLSLQRVTDYWAKDLPTARGLNNFGTIRTEFFRDPTIAFQAFKAGTVDWRRENISKQWSTGYDFPAVRKGLVKKQSFASRLPTGMQCYAMNTRRDVFKDRRVRQAMCELFDFQWTNKNLFYGLYTRTSSFFSGSDCASSGLPGEAELALLEPHKDKLPPELFTTEFKLPVTDGSGNNHEGMVRAWHLFEQAGYKLQDRKMVDPAGKPVSFEILLYEPAFERVTDPYAQALAKMGIDARVRIVDPAEYQHLTDPFEFDMTVNVFAESDSPGNELWDFWGSASAKEVGSNNLCGVADPVVDELIGRVVRAPDRDALVVAARALDRVLLWNWYVVPQWHLAAVWAAWWDRFGFVDVPIRSGMAFDSWWVVPELAAKTDAARHSGI
jgi:microcin C transport system substrate-binding protein